jgi:hypothetical protein
LLGLLFTLLTAAIAINHAMEQRAQQAANAGKAVGEAVGDAIVDVHRRVANGEIPMDAENYVAPYSYGWTVVIGGRRYPADSSDNDVWTNLAAAQQEYVLLRVKSILGMT